MRFFITVICLGIYLNAHSQTYLKKQESNKVSSFFNKDSLQKEYDYLKEDSVICHSVFDPNENREVFISVDKRPTFGKDLEELRLYILKNVNNPLIYFDIEGTVYVRFIVEQDGTLTNAQIVRRLDNRLDNEAIKLVQNMPRWQPGECNGQKVPVYYIIPIPFHPMY